jgi:hypothetical protein
MTNTPAYYAVVSQSVKVLLHKLPKMLKLKWLADFFYLLMKNESSLKENTFFPKESKNCFHEEEELNTNHIPRYSLIM